MENVQAAISPPSSVAPAKASATEAAVDENGAPLPGGFMAVLNEQVKSLKAGFKSGKDGADVCAADADSATGSTDAALPADPLAVAVPLLATLPPALMPAILQAAAAAAASPGAAALALAATAASALASPGAPAAAPKQASAAKLPVFPGGGQPAAAGGPELAADAAGQDESGAALEPRAAPAHSPVAAGATADLAARAEQIGRASCRERV